MGWGNSCSTAGTSSSHKEPPWQSKLPRRSHHEQPFVCTSFIGPVGAVSPSPVCWPSSGCPRGREAQQEADGGIGEPGRAVAERQQQQPRVPAHGVAAAGPAGQQRVCHGAGDAGQAGAAQAVQQDGAPGVWGDRAGSPRRAGGTGATRGGTHRTPGSGGRRQPGSPPGAAPIGAGSRSAPLRGPSSLSGSHRVQ